MGLAIKGEYPSDWAQIAKKVKDEAGWKCIRCGHEHDFESGHVLTVHHFDGDKSNCRWWNLLALCQRCHLSIQAKVNPHQPYMFEHSDWIKPYVAGYYAFKYEKAEITKEEAIDRMEELLKYERFA